MAGGLQWSLCQLDEFNAGRDCHRQQCVNMVDGRGAIVASVARAGVLLRLSILARAAVLHAERADTAQRVGHARAALIRLNGSSDGRVCACSQLAATSMNDANIATSVRAEIKNGVCAAAS